MRRLPSESRRPRRARLRCVFGEAYMITRSLIEWQPATCRPVPQEVTLYTRHPLPVAGYSWHLTHGVRPWTINNNLTRNPKLSLASSERSEFGDDCHWSPIRSSCLRLPTTFMESSPRLMRQMQLSRRVGTTLPGSVWTKQRRHIASASDGHVLVPGGME